MFSPKSHIIELRTAQRAVQLIICCCVTQGADLAVRRGQDLTETASTKEESIIFFEILQQTVKGLTSPGLPPHNRVPANQRRTFCLPRPGDFIRGRNHVQRTNRKIILTHNLPATMSETISSPCTPGHAAATDAHDAPAPADLGLGVNAVEEQVSELLFTCRQLIRSIRVLI